MRNPARLYDNNLRGMFLGLLSLLLCAIGTIGMVAFGPEVGLAFVGSALVLISSGFLLVVLSIFQDG